MIVCLASALVFLAAIIGGPQRGELRLDQWHHAYLGLLGAGLGVLLGAGWLLVAGTVVVADDAAQHLFQRLNYPALGDAALLIRSPLNILYRTLLGGVPWISALNQWLDHLLH